MGFLKSLFTSTAEDPQAKQQKEIHKKFELLKYDGMRAHRMEQIDIAVQCFEKALLLEDDFETRGYLARLYIRTHRMGEAHSLLYPMFQEEPTHLPTLMALGYTYYLLNMYDRAAELAQTVLSIEENNAEAHTLLGAAIIRQINKDNNPDADILLVAGVAQLTIALMLDETLRNARLLRAQTCLLMYRYDDARADAEYLLAADAFNEEAYICLVESYLAQQQFDEPLRILDEAIELIPISIPLYQERAKVKRLMGDDEGAAADEQQAAELLTEE